MQSMPSQTWIYDLAVGLFIWAGFVCVLANIVYYIGMYRIWRKFHEVLQKVI